MNGGPALQKTYYFTYLNNLLNILNRECAITQMADGQNHKSPEKHVNPRHFDKPYYIGVKPIDYD